MKANETIGSANVDKRGDGGAMSSGTRTKFDPPRVLVVDDTPDNLDLFVLILGEAGMLVTTATNGGEALDAVERERPAVVLMDLSMPVLDGFAAVEALRETETGRNAYVIAVSAHSEAAWRKRALAVGCDEFLAKPCSPSALIDRVRAAIDAGAPRAAAG